MERSPCAQAGTHDCRLGRQRRHPSGAHRRGDTASAAAARVANEWKANERIGRGIHSPRACPPYRAFAWDSLAMCCTIAVCSSFTRARNGEAASAVLGGCDMCLPRDRGLSAWVAVFPSGRHSFSRVLRRRVDPLVMQIGYHGGPLVRLAPIYDLVVVVWSPYPDAMALANIEKR